ncbi:MAG: DUF1592 domain-containing protein [Planctomycetes bacterium]|nr:DUF1592 domain-containing protein [Planctomycetota bacterium]
MPVFLACSPGGLVSAAEPAATWSLEGASAASAQAFEHVIAPLLTTYCGSCHHGAKAKGDLDLARFATGTGALAERDVWKTCAAKLLAREMPPDKERKQPSDAERGQLLAWMNGLRRLSPRTPGPGLLRRLSQAEYANTLHDLLGVDPQVASELPRDVVGEGYSSSISPLLMEKYLLIADQVLDEIILPEQLVLKWNAGQLDAIADGTSAEGRPDGAERRISGPGEISALVAAPVDGTYTVRLLALAEKTASREPLRLAVRVDNRFAGEIKAVATGKTTAAYTVTCRLAAGRAKISVMLVNPFIEPEAGPPAAPSGGRPKPGATNPKPPTPAAAKPPTPGDLGRRTVTIQSLEVLGPPALPPSAAQKRIFVAMPGKDVSRRDAAAAIARAFARRAYRRPPSANEVAALLDVFALADAQDEVFSEAVKLMLKAVLVAPAFLFLTPDDAASAAPGIVPLGEHQVAARLSYLIWSTMPDDELAALADAGRLRTPVMLAQQTRRLLADPRAHALFDGFGAPWLGLDRLADLAFVERKGFPPLTSDLRRAMYEEGALLFGSILRENRSMVELITADYTWMNGPLARIYGLEATVKGPQMRRVDLADGNRGGVLTLPGVLAVTSLPARTSPVKRGQWVMAQILGQEPPPPPMNVPPLERQDTPANSQLTLRQRTERHRADPACAGCHRMIDPLGFGLENFDPLGRWRDRDDTGGAVDATGALPGGATFRSPQELKRLLAGRQDEFCRTIVAKLLAYTLCRHLDGYDEVVVDQIAAAAAQDGYRLQTVLVGIVASYPFLNRDNR